MNFEHDFVIDLPVAQAWALLCDVEGIAPCVPGAQLQEVEGDEYRGVVKVKLGPITAQYKGAVVVAERDALAHRMVMNAKARDVHGQGNASATVVAELKQDGAITRVALATELQITGKVAQLGRGVMQDVSGKLIQQFADGLRQKIAAEPVIAVAPVEAPVAPVSTTIETLEPPKLRQIDSAPVEAVDLLAASRAAIFKRIGIGILVIVIAVILIKIIR